MTGIITLWFGNLAAIPLGWALCDGAGGTPDLRDFIPVGAGSTYAVDDSAGNVNHNHAFTSNMHQHDINAGATLFQGTQWDKMLGPNTARGTFDNSSSLPPYHGLGYIQKT